MEQIIALAKWLQSFTKTDWTANDYPLRKEMQDDGVFWVRPINWWVINGTGSTEEEAMRDFADQLKEFKARDGSLPRPGTNVPLRFADSSRIDAHGDFAYRLIEELLGTEVFFICDGTPLDMYAEDDNQYAIAIQTLNDRYGLGLAPDEEISVDELLERIAEKR